jgi:hypothetical protein
VGEAERITAAKRRGGIGRCATPDRGTSNEYRPLDTPAFMLFDRPDRFCTRRVFPRWAKLMDTLLPNTQFLITLDQPSRRVFPQSLLSGTCRLPVPEDQPRKFALQLPRKAVLLVDLDSRLPNLALMKLSRFFKDQGRRAVLVQREARLAGVECVYASGVFSTPSTPDRLSKLRRYYADALIAGGTGIDASLRLPAEVECLPADYSLYPELGDCAIGFLTRGCPFQCAFCVVPVKEGGVRQVSDLDDHNQNDSPRAMCIKKCRVGAICKIGPLEIGRRANSCRAPLRLLRLFQSTIQAHRDPPVHSASTIPAITAHAL